MIININTKILSNREFLEDMKTVCEWGGRKQRAKNQHPLAYKQAYNVLYRIAKKYGLTVNQVTDLAYNQTGNIKKLNKTILKEKYAELVKLKEEFRKLQNSIAVISNDIKELEKNI